jgi:precorrin-6A/cobalt-precorrin-6A reductase
MVGKRVLILGGTTQAIAAARELNAIAGISVITSLAGVTRNPSLSDGDHRRGGFGGVDGMTAYLREAEIALVIDATHPFAAQISHHAADASVQSGCPIVHLTRKPWRQEPGDRWHVVSDTKDAAAWLGASPLPDQAVVFLTIGRMELAAFASVGRFRFIARSIEPPISNGTTAVERTILARGPFSFEDERRLLIENDIACLVAKNSGGTASRPKIDAARSLELPVVMIDQPAPPRGKILEDVAAVVAWARKTLALER